MTKLKLTEEYNDALSSLLKEEPALEYILKNEISVGIIASEAAKKNGGHLVCAECRKTSELCRLFAPYDFIITVYEPNCEGMTDAQIRTLLFHELLHIGVEEKDDDIRTFTKAHDLEDFKIIIDRFGVDWARR